MITAIRGLEEENKSLKAPGCGIKLSTELNNLKNIINKQKRK